jgi:hypothetical protein
VRTILLALVVVVAGCRVRATKPPYTRGNEPDPTALLAATQGRYTSLRVPKAKIREGRSPGARLQIRAEAPARMVGGIDLAGNPLVTLALHERGYALRTVRNAPGLPAGFYSGPPSDCAVAALLGVELKPEQIVALLLGGGPVIDGPHQFLDQTWRDGREHLRLANERYEETLEFVWVDGRWWFAGASLYARTPAAPVWLWTIRHDKVTATPAGVLPGKTTIRRPTSGGDEVAVSIAYAKQITAPLSPEDGGDGGDVGSFGDDGGWEGDAPLTDAHGTGEPEDDWDDEGWEDDPGEPAPDLDTSAPDPDPAEDPIPAAYRLTSAGLIDRGDLCAAD